MSVREGEYLCAYLKRTYKMAKSIYVRSLQHSKEGGGEQGSGVVTSFHESASASRGMKRNL